MTHKADSSFFDVKREWSKRKDLVLGHYLTPYLRKVARLGKPVLIVDGFAGRGQFLDGNPGSPLIITKIVDEARSELQSSVFNVLCIEASADLVGELRGFVGNGATVLHDRFQNQIGEIASRSKRASVFLYLDPYTSAGLHIADLRKVFDALTQGMSVEVLMNFNSVAIARHGASLLGVKVESDEVERLEPESIKSDTIDLVLGGSWWQPILRSNVEFAKKVSAITDGYCDRLRAHFKEVLTHSVFERSTQALPKYTLVFGSRHPDALEFMNDAMAKSRGLQASAEKPKHDTLFETRSEALVPDTAKLPGIVLEAAQKGRMTRRDLMNSVVRHHLGKYLWKEIRGAVQRHLETGAMKSSTGLTKINDDVEVWAQNSRQ